MEAGRGRARPNDRFLLSAMSCRSPVVGLGRSRVEFREPAQRPQTRSEAVFSAASHDERWQCGEPTPDRLLRNRERARPVVRSDDRILLGWSADEDAVVEPLRLDELELS